MKTLVAVLVISCMPSPLFAREGDGERGARTGGGLTDQVRNAIVAAEESGESGGNTEHASNRISMDDPSIINPGRNNKVENENALFHVVPPAYTGTPGTSTFLGPLANAARTYQLLIHDSMLTSLVGKRLTGLSWRIPTSATAAWPVADVTFTNYDVYLSGSVAPANRSLTFASNVVGVQTQVQSGSLTIPMESYPFGGSPNAFGPEITLTPWLYSGGHLLVEIRHAGFSGTSRSTDAIGTAISGYGTLFSAAWVGNYTGTSGSQGNFTVIRLTADSVTVSVGDDDRRVPTTLTLDQNFPNPFNPATTITFALPASGYVRLNVYDVLGNEVAVLVNEEMRAGDHLVILDASRLASGMYFYRLQSGGFVQTRSLLVLK